MRESIRQTKWDKAKRNSAEGIKEGIGSEKRRPEETKSKTHIQKTFWRRRVIGATYCRESENHNQEDRTEKCECPLCETGEVEDLHHLWRCPAWNEQRGLYIDAMGATASSRVLKRHGVATKVKGQEWTK